MAAAAGVSVSTVSRVLDERLPQSRTTTAERVRHAAEELGYFRNITASSLRRGDTGTVGVLVPRLTDTVMSLMFEAIYVEAERRGQFALVSICGDDPSSSRKAADALLGRRVDGLLIAASQIDDPLARSLRDRGTPHVLVLRTDGISPSSVCDDELGGYLATRYLIDLGHENIGILAGPDFASTARGRLAGYTKAMSEAGLVPDDGWIANSGFGFEAGRKTCAELLESHPEVTAYFGVNDRLALGGIFAARTHGLRVPEDISFVGYNDTPLAVQQPTGLTSVRVPFDHVAAAALDLLGEQIGAGSLPTGTCRTATPTLVPRQTVQRRQ
ncbi:LacI family DNA-binding transcriptional regulator [Ancrocorticia populi]|uniref:LacI family DNA-binding transcriptional regulator n=1 Tax=Ancrocorticia populi TaxID=2175228 RepID=UPI0023569BAB|nr:LacI family DNA-binding transcriptional regulator [Ancrocorticia populi]